MERTFHMLLYRAFHAQRNFLRPSLGELGLGPGQPKLLNYLMNRGPCRQRELADYFEIDPAAVCRMLDCLQKSGFVTRRADGQSRRRDVVELTEAGRQINLDWQRRCRVMEEAMLSGAAGNSSQALGAAHTEGTLRREQCWQIEKTGRRLGV